MTWQAGKGQPVIDVRPAPRPDGSTVQFLSQGTGEDLYVFPTDMAEYLASGVVDRELFNIPGLLEQGLDDASTRQLPVMVIFDGKSTKSLSAQRASARLSADADGLPATRHPIPLRSLNGAGVQVVRDKAQDFWEALDSDSTSAQRNDDTRLAGGVERILLDRQVQATLDVSVPQIGAPKVWEEGHTGEGVKVAVLDTGIDSGHPDLVGNVTAEHNFTESESVTDRFGHGTHVASTIAGSGAASDGKYKGVAPGAALMNGKVLGDNGSGSLSWTIAGMEWAASNGADVVNLSLGSCCWSDGTDPAALAVDQLTAEYDTLFVIAAGNNGASGIGTPGTADAALTVGAVDKSDQLAWFSSRGARKGDFAVKPDITAPGVQIVAARAAGTTLPGSVHVGEHYTTASGTSMATPHVAGAAALLTQSRPGLNAAELKDALASTSVDVGYTSHEQGSGRVDVARAVDQGVYASSSVNFGKVDNVDAAVERAVTYTNHTDTPVTLNLESEVTNEQGEGADNVVLTDDTVTVPAGGSTTVTATIDPSAYPLGVYGGVITATSADVQLRTAIGFGKLNQQKVTVKVVDSEGNPYDPPGGVTLTQDTWTEDSPLAERFYRVPTANGAGTAHVPAGTYTVMALVAEGEDQANGNFTRITALAKVDVAIRSDSTLTLDAAETVPVRQPAVPRDVDVRSHIGSLIHRAPVDVFTGAGFTPSISWIDYSPSGQPIPIFVSPSSPAEMGSISLADYWLLAEPQPFTKMPNAPGVYTEAPAYTYHLSFGYPDGIPARIAHNVKRSDLVAVPNQYHGERPDSVVTVSEFAVSTEFQQNAFYNPYLVVRPGKTTQYYLADDSWFWLRQVLLWSQPDRPIGFPWIELFAGDRFMDAEAGTRRQEESWFEGPLHVGAAEVADDAFVDWYAGNVFYQQRSATMARGGPDGNEFVPAVDLVDNSGHSAGDRLGENWWWDLFLDSWGTWRMWNADTGTELEPDHKYGETRPVFHLSNKRTRYRLQAVETYPEFAKGLLRTRPKATTEWSFRSKPSDSEVADGYSCGRLGGGNPIWDPEYSLICQFQPLIQLNYELGLDIQNRATAGRPHKFTIEAGAHLGAPDRARVTDLSVEYSTDDGQTWRRGKVLGKPKTRDGLQRFTVVVTHPPLHRTDKAVWLRVKAADINGGTVQQTIQRAYLLK